MPVMSSSPSESFTDARQNKGRRVSGVTLIRLYLNSMLFGAVFRSSRDHPDSFKVPTPVNI